MGPVIDQSIVHCHKLILLVTASRNIIAVTEALSTKCGWLDEIFYEMRVIIRELDPSKRL